MDRDGSKRRRWLEGSQQLVLNTLAPYDSASTLALGAGF